MKKSAPVLLTGNGGVGKTFMATMLNDIYSVSTIPATQKVTGKDRSSKNRICIDSRRSKQKA